LETEPDSRVVCAGPAVTTRYRLVELVMTAAVGAALIAAAKCNVEIRGIDRAKFVRVLFDSAADK